MSAYDRLEELKGYQEWVRRDLENLDLNTSIEATGVLVVRDMAISRLIAAAEREHIKESEQTERDSNEGRKKAFAAVAERLERDVTRRVLADRLAFLHGMGQNPTVEERAKIQRGEVSNHEVLEARYREIESIKSELATV